MADMNNLWTETGYVSINKQGEQLCGDRVRILSHPEQDSITLVLADGLGSGVKANILSTLTATMLSTMIDEGMPIEDCVETMASTLPICQVRKVAYSTFSIIKVTGNSLVEIIQYDNPKVFVIRNGKNYEYPCTSREIAGKTILESRFSLAEGDRIVAMSDGAIYAGVGQTLNFGWQRENIISYAETLCVDDLSAQMLASSIVDECNRLYDFQPGDDTTVAVARVRPRQSVNLWIGPPENRSSDQAALNLFFAKQGLKVICGGTTASLAARYLGRPLNTDIDYLDPEVPPISHLQGVDLVTEGVITISKVLEYAKAYLDGTDLNPKWLTGKDGASQIARILFERATDIQFFVGKAINPAHQNPDLPIRFGIKIQLIQDLAAALEKMGKHIHVSYF